MSGNIGGHTLAPGQNTADGGVAVFGGDQVVSGNLHVIGTKGLHVDYGVKFGNNQITASDGGTPIIWDTSDNVTIAGDLTVGGNDIKSNGGSAALTLSGSGNVGIEGDLTVHGSDIKDSDGTARLSFSPSGNTQIRNSAGSVVASATSGGALSLTQDLNVVRDVNVTGDVYISGSDIHLNASNDATIGSTMAAGRNLTLGSATSNVVIAGNLAVSGSTTSIDTVNMTVKDSIIALGVSGSDGGYSTVGQRGILFPRGADSSAVAGFWWDGTRFQLGTSKTSAASGSFASVDNYDSLMVTKAEFDSSADHVSVSDGRLLATAGGGFRVDAAKSIELDSATSVVGVTGSLLPGADDTYDIGSATMAWQDAYLEGDLYFTDRAEIDVASGLLHVDVAGSIQLDSAAAVIGVTGSMLPGADDTYDLGSATMAWQDLFLEGDITLTDAGTIATSAGDLTIDTGADIVLSASDYVRVENNLALDSASSAIYLSSGFNSVVSLTHDGTAGLTVAANAASGKLTLDTTGDITLDSDSGKLLFKDGGTEIGRLANDGSANLVVSSSNDMIFSSGDNQIEVFRLDDSAGSLLVASSKKIELGHSDEYVYGDGTDIHIGVGSGGDINIPTDIGLTFGHATAEKIEGDGSGMTVTSQALTLDSAADITLDAGGGDVVFKDDGTEIGRFVNSSTNLVISSSNDMIFSSGDNQYEIFRLDDSASSLLVSGTRKIEFGDSSQYIHSDEGLVNLTIGATTDVNVEATTLDVNAALDVSGISTLTGDVTFGGHIVADGNEAKNIFAAVTSNAITIGGGGDVVLGGDLKMAANGRIEDAGGHARFIATDAGHTELGSADGTARLRVETGGQITLSGDMVLSGTSIDVDSASGLTIGANIGANNLTLGATTSTVVVPGNLTVEGSTVSLDVANLRVDDPVILLGSGSTTANSNGGLALVSGSATSNTAMVLGRVANDVWGVGTKDVNNGSVTTLADMDLGAMRVNTLQLSGTDGTIDLYDNTDLRMRSLTNNIALFTPTAGKMILMGINSSNAASAFLVTDQNNTTGNPMFAVMPNLSVGRSSRLYDSSNPQDYLQMSVTTNGASTVMAVDQDGSSGHLYLSSSGDMQFQANGNDFTFNGTGGTGGLNVNVSSAGASGQTTIGGGTTGNDIVFKADAGGGNTIMTIDDSEEALMMASSKKLMLGAAEEYLYGDGTDIHIGVGSGGDVNVPADIGVTFGHATGDKIEGDGSRMTVTSQEFIVNSARNIELDSATTHIGVTGSLLPSADDTHDLGSATLAWQDLFLEGDITLTDAGSIATSAGDLTLDSAGDLVLDAGGADWIFKDDGTEIARFVNSSANLIVSSSNDMIFSSGDNETEVFRLDDSAGSLLVASSKKIELGHSDEHIYGDGTDIHFGVGSAGNINIPTNIGLNFAGNSETQKIESDNTNLTLTSAGNVVIAAQHLTPSGNGSQDLGGASNQWRNIYTGDLHLSNERGNWTMVEEENMLTIRNNRNGKWYRMAMEEIDPTGRDAGMAGAPPKASDDDVEWEF